MKVYEGGRSLDGAVVAVDGRPLPPRVDLRRLSKAGQGSNGSTSGQARRN